MAYENTGKGALWRNDSWQDGSKQPKWTGKIVADRPIAAGEEIPLAVWPNEKSGERVPVMRLQVDRWKERKAQEAGFKPKGYSAEARAAERAPTPSAIDDDFSDQIPF